VILTNRGGRVLSWQLKEYKTAEGVPLQVIPDLTETEHLPLGVDLADTTLAGEINKALFLVEREALSPSGGKGRGERIRFLWADGRGLEVTKALEFRDGDYLVGAEVQVNDRGRKLPVRITWGPGFETRSGASGGLGSYYYTSQVLWNLSGKVRREKKIKEELSGAGNLYWAGMEDQYFAALILPRSETGGIRVWPVEARRTPVVGKGEVQEAEKLPVVAVEVPAEGAQIFVGPKNYSMLQEMGHDLDQAVWFSSVTLFAWMARLLYRVLVWLHGNVVPNYGFAIILTTVLLRMVLFPLNQFSMVRMKRMQTDMGRIQPKMNAIKAKYRKKKDAEGRAKMNQELMELYKKEGVNPMGGMTGCLPLFAQFPILIGFYDMLVAAVELRGAPFFAWIQDLTLKDPYYVTPILMGATMFLQQKMSMTKLGDPTQQRIMMMTPVIFTVMFLNLPSGLVLYWFVNNLLGIGQQWLVNRHIGRLERASQRV